MVLPWRHKLLCVVDVFSFISAGWMKRDRWQSDVAIKSFQVPKREDNIATFRPPMRIVAL